MRYHPSAFVRATAGSLAGRTCDHFPNGIGERELAAEVKRLGEGVLVAEYINFCHKLTARLGIGLTVE